MDWSAGSATGDSSSVRLVRDPSNKAVGCISEISVSGIIGEDRKLKWEVIELDTYVACKASGGTYGSLEGDYVSVRRVVGTEQLPVRSDEPIGVGAVDVHVQVNGLPAGIGRVIGDREFLQRLCSNEVGDQ